MGKVVPARLSRRGQVLALTRAQGQSAMSTPSAKPAYVTLHRLGQLSGKARNTLLLRMRDGELLADATLDVGGNPRDRG